MCIRDRLHRLGALLPARELALFETDGGRTAAGSARALSEPVSYTHLRAHETVLDLVCRLLLEKKNTI